MFARRRMYVFLSIAVLGTLGCSGAREVRYVYQDGHSGVIGLPANTSQWPTYYRKHADKLMEKHFPEGYEVVRAEEVVEGSRTLTINGSNAAEIQPSASANFLALGKLGRSTSRSQSDTLKIKECRILYKKAEPIDPQKQHQYEEQALWTPAPYVDPNAIDRKLAKAKPGELKSIESGTVAKGDGAPASENTKAAKTAQASGGPSAPDKLPKADNAVLEASRGAKPGSVSP